MKNFNLLLATTAILSMGAVAVNAESYPAYTSAGIKIPVNVGLVNSMTYKVDSDLNFGVAMLNPSLEGTIAIPADGSTPTYTNAIKLKDGTRGAISLNVADAMAPTGISLVLPDNEHPLTLTSGTGENLRTCGTVNNFSQSPVVIVDGLIAINVGGTFKVSSGLTIDPYETLNCSADLTVTLVHN